MVWIGLASASRNNVFGLVWFGSVGLALLVCLALLVWFWFVWFGFGSAVEAMSVFWGGSPVDLQPMQRGPAPA